MLPEVALEEFSAALDQVVADFLATAECDAPPVNAIALARRLGIDVAFDARLAGRARTAQVAATARSAQPSILIRPEPRAERRQWAVAHEIGEQLAQSVFAALGISPEEAGEAARERVANLLASRLLLPTSWFAPDARHWDCDLFALKRRYATASHELIARRLLDLAAPVILSVFDQDRLTWRKSNVAGRVPPLSAAELECLRDVRSKEAAVDESLGNARVQGWPIHEPGWRREILRMEIEET
jgi:hypothetical protein